MTLNRRSDFPLYLCFFFSGAAGLAYEVLWARILGLAFGHTVYAVTTVLAAFMGGLALGSFLFGKIADRHKNPLRLYAFLELSIGFYCLLTPSLLDLTRQGYLSLYGSLLSSPSARILVQFLLGYAVLLIPATLMGGTLPVMAKAVVRSPELTGRNVAILYGTNTMGAAIGALAAGYWIIPAIGNRSTNLLGAGTNILVGVIILSVYRTTASKPPPDTSALIPKDPRVSLDQVLLWSFAISGAVAMLYQIAWIRTLVLVIGSSTYALSSILVTFLTGIALGSFIFTRFKRGETPLFFSLLQIGIGISAFALIPLFSQLPGLFLSLFRGYQDSYGYIQLVQFTIVAVVVLIPTTLMGMTFPCLTGILTRNIRTVGGDVGRFYAYNTLGAIAGSILTGFVFIPILGVQKTLMVGIVLNLGIAATVLSLVYPAARRFTAIGLTAVLVILALIPGWSKTTMNSGVWVEPFYYLQKDPGIKKIWVEDDQEYLFFREGVSSTVAVTKNSEGVKALWVNGKAEAGIRPDDLETFSKAAYIPMLLHPNPQRVAVVGLGAGITAGFTAAFTTPSVIDIVELEAGVVEGSDYFRKENLDFRSDPRVRIVVDDGRSFIGGAKEGYDVIISYPSNIWVSGVTSLFTEEFMHDVYAKLSPGGIFSQWIQGYRMHPEDLRMVIRTFMSVFPDTTLWEGSPADFILIGRKEKAGSVTRESILSHVERSPRLEAAFIDADVQAFEALLASFRLDRTDLEVFVGEGPLNSDDRNILEFSGPKSLYIDPRFEITDEIHSLRKSSLPHFIAGTDMDLREYHIGLGRYLLKRGRLDEASRVFRKIPPVKPNEEDGVKTVEAGPVRDEKLAKGVRLDFSKEPEFSLVPQVGAFKPEEEENLRLWQVSRDYFTRVSGLFHGEGRNGSAGLKIQPIDNVRFTGYFLPLEVKSDTEYKASVWIRHRIEDGNRAGIGIMEYNSAITEKDQSAAFNKKHLISSASALQVTENSPWKRHTFAFRTSPGTGLVRLLFYYDGMPETGWVSFDDLKIRKN